MRVELNSVVLTGLGATADSEKLKANAVSGENIRMGISSNLRFPEARRVECLVTVESSSDSEAVKLRCTYLGDFTIVSDSEITDGDQMKISAMCTAKIFPYIKELIADITRRLPLNSPLYLHPSLGDEEILLRQMNMQPEEMPSNEKAQ